MARTEHPFDGCEDEESTSKRFFDAVNNFRLSMSSEYDMCVSICATLVAIEEIRKTGVTINVDEAIVSIVEECRAMSNSLRSAAMAMAIFLHEESIKRSRGKKGGSDDFRLN